MSISLLQALHSVPIAVLDFETTGAAAELGDRVVEIGIVRLLNGQVVERYAQLVDPQRRISPGASAITGITQSMVTGQPTFADVRDRVCEMLSGAIVVGHNVGFDLSFLHREFARLRCDLCEQFGHTHVLDTVKIARRRFGRGGNGLSRLAARLMVPQTTAHRALADAETTAGVLDRLLAPVGGWAMMLCDALVQQGGPIAFKPADRTRSLPWELDEALESQLPVMMEYLDGDQNRTRRVISSMHVKKLNGELLLVAHCQLRQAQRTFKVERIVSVTKIEAEPSAAETPVQQLLFPI